MSTTITLLDGVPSIEARTLKSILATMDADGWNFDVLGLACEDRPLFFLGVVLFDVKHDHFYHDVHVDPVAMRNFLFVIDAGYLQNPYVRRA